MPLRIQDALAAPMRRRDALQVLAVASGSALLTGCGLSVRSPRRQLGTTEWAELQARVAGRVVARSSADYVADREAMAWNAVKPERFPDAIVHVASDTDVCEAIRFARKHNLRVAIRGGGHNWHTPLRQGGLMLDLGGLNQVQVDVERQKAVVQPGVKGAAFIAALAPYGLAFPVGHEPDVGLSGFLLNGGLGWNWGNWGPSCASIEAIDVVNAHGDLIRANSDQNADLLWAAQGAGPGFFGVVTRLHLKAYPMPRAILRTSLRFAIEDFDKVAAWRAEILRSGPAEIEFTFMRQRINVRAWAFADTIADARAALRPLEADPPGLVAQRKRLYEALTVEQLFGFVNDGAGPGPRVASDAVWSNASAPELLSGLRDIILAAPSDNCTVQFWHAHGPGWPPQRDMAFSVFANTYVDIFAGWNEPQADAAHQAWVRSAITSLESRNVGGYIGDTDTTIVPNQARQCFSPSAWAKLARLKRQYDPDDVFFSYLQHA